MILLDLTEPEEIRIAIWTATFALISSLIMFFLNLKSNKKIEQVKGDIEKETEILRNELTKQRESRSEREKIYLAYASQNNLAKINLYRDFLQYLVEYNQQLTTLNGSPSTEEIETISKVMYTLTATLKIRAFRNSDLWVEKNVEEIEMIGPRLYLQANDIFRIIKSNEEIKEEHLNLKIKEIKNYTLEMQKLLKTDIKLISEEYVKELESKL